MKRWAMGGAAALCLAAGAALFWPRGPEAFPLAEEVPADALFYAGFREGAELEAAVARFAPDHLKAIRENRILLAGASAFYVDAKGEGIFLARLPTGSVSVTAPNDEAKRRHEARRGSLAETESFRALGSRVYLNLEKLRLPGRLGDFAAVGMEIEPGPGLAIRGRAAYRPSVLRTYLEHYVQAPRRAAPDGGAVFVEPLPRLWEDLLDALPPGERDRFERHTSSLSRDFLEGRSFRAFLRKLGPSWGCAVAPGSPPGFVGWIEVPDAAARETLVKMLHRTANDIDRLARDRGEAPGVELSVEGSVWRLRWGGAWARRWEESFAPAYALSGDRLVFATRPDLLKAPAVAEGSSHVGLSMEAGAVVEAARGLVPVLAEAGFWEEAEREADRDFRRWQTPATETALARQMPERYERAKHVASLRARMAVDAMARLSQTPRFQEERQRQEARVDAWGARLKGASRLEFNGRYTGSGLEFRLTVTD